MPVLSRTTNFALFAIMLYLGTSTQASNSETSSEAIANGPNKPIIAYDNNLARPEVNWSTVLSTEKAKFVPSRGIISSGPYYIDTNHREGALLVGPLVVGVNRSAASDLSHAPVGKLDLRNTTVRFNLKLTRTTVNSDSDVLAGGKLVFWFQATLDRRAVAGGDYKMPPRHVNYIFNYDFTDEATTGAAVEVPVFPDLNMWTCLGRNPVDVRPIIGSAAKYTCALNQAEFSEAMANPESMGFLFLLPTQTDDGKILNFLDAAAPSRTLTMDQWTFALREFTIVRSEEPAPIRTGALPGFGLRAATLEP